LIERGTRLAAALWVPKMLTHDKASYMVTRSSARMNEKQVINRKAQLIKAAPCFLWITCPVNVREGQSPWVGNLDMTG